MQFGRLTGAGIAVLGTLLLLLQFGFFLNSNRSGIRRAEERRDFSVHDRPEARVHRVPLLPGIPGAVLVLGGVAVFFLSRMEDEPDRKNAIK